MKWEKTPALDAELRRLSPDELTLFRTVVREEFVPAAERRAADAGKSVQGASGIWKMTWSFSGPEG